MKRFLKSKPFIVLVAILVVLISCVVLFFTVSEYARFKRIENAALSIAGEIGTGNNYFKLDTKTSRVPLDEMTDFQKSWHLQQQAKAIEAIKSTNRKLGFDESLYTYMSVTTVSMGTLKKENKKYIVSWTYSHDDGLEVEYQIKTSAMFKIGGKLNEKV